MKFTKEEKALWLEDWRRSGKKAWAYAKENGLMPQTFCSWAKKAETKSSLGFVEITKQIKMPNAMQAEIRIEKGGINIYVPLAVWAESSAAVVEGMKAAL
jgi:hypothetical protein